MTLRRVIILSTVLAVLVATLFIKAYLGADGPPFGTRPGEAVLPSLNLNEIGRVEITRASQTAILARKDKKWVVESLDDSPADFMKLAEALQALAELKIARVINDDQPNGLEEKPITLTLMDDAGTPLHVMTLNAQGYYLQVTNGPVVFVKDPLTGFDSDNKLWIRMP